MESGTSMRSWMGALSVALLVLADQATKLLALAFLDPRPEGPAVRLVRGAIYLKLSPNAGGIWGLLESAGPLFFVGVTVAVVVWIAFLVLRLDESDRAFSFPLLLLLGGFVGNGIDRIRLGHVVDYIYMTWYSRAMISTFNLADLAILLGLAWAVGLCAARAARSCRRVRTGGG